MAPVTHNMHSYSPQFASSSSSIRKPRPASGVYLGAATLDSVPRFGAKKKSDKKSDAETLLENKKAAYEEYTKDEGLFRGSIGQGFGRIVKAYASPLGAVELAVDIGVVVSTVGLVPPPFATKHFIEGWIGANSLYSTKPRGVMMKALAWFQENKEFVTGQKGQKINRTVWNAVSTHVSNWFREHKLSESYDLQRYLDAQ